MNPNYLNLNNEHPSTVHPLEVRQELDASESLSQVYADAYGGERHFVMPSAAPASENAEHLEALAFARENVRKLYEPKENPQN